MCVLLYVSEELVTTRPNKKMVQGSFKGIWRVDSIHLEKTVWTGVQPLIIEKLRV